MNTGAVPLIKASAEISKEIVSEMTTEIESLSTIIRNEITKPTYDEFLTEYMIRTLSQKINVLASSVQQFLLDGVLLEVAIEEAGYVDFFHELEKREAKTS